MITCDEAVKKLENAYRIKELKVSFDKSYKNKK